MIASSIGIGILYSIFFQANLGEVFLWEMLYNVNVALLKLPMMILQGVISQRTLAELNRGERTYMELFWCVLVVVLTALIIGELGSYPGWINSVLRKKGHLLLLCVLQWWLLSGNMMLGQNGFELVDLFVNIAIIVCVTLMLQWLWVFGDYERRCLENQVLDTSQMMTQKYNAAMGEIYEQNAKKLHDVKHYMLSAVGYLEQGDMQNARAVLETYLGNGEQTEVCKVWTGFPVLDYMLNYKRTEMNKYEITFTLEQELYEYPFEDAEMGVVLGNLLDNAIEAAMQCEVGQRTIHMVIKNTNHMFLLKIKNSSTKLPVQKNGRFVTSKANKNAHGLGIESVKNIVQKYGGNIDFQYDAEMFEVVILL